MSIAAEHKTTKRDQIIEAAKAEFHENGFAGASMDRVSERAGASKRTVYRYFESKEALFRALIEEHWAQFAETLDVSYRRGVDIRDQLAAIGWAEGRLFMSPSVMATTRMIMSELLRTPALADEDQKKTDYGAALAVLLADAARDGQLALDDPQTAADEFIGLLKAKAFWPVVLGAPVLDAAAMRQVIDSSVEMFMSRYGRAA